jgi:hypothetical protein
MRRQMAAMAILGLLAAGCGGSDDLFDQLSDRVGSPDEPSDDDQPEPAPDPADDDEGDQGVGDPDAGDAGDAGGGDAGGGDQGVGGSDEGDLPAFDPADFPTIEERVIDQAVQYGVIEWSVEEMVVVDLDADLQPGEQPQGVELTFPTRVYNAGGNTASVTTTPIALQWDDPGTGDTFTVAVQADFRDVPAESFTSGELRALLPPDDRAIFDDDSAYLLVGRPGVTPATVPIGSGVEAVDRLPVPQDTEGWTFEIEGEDTARRAIADTVIVTGAEVRWSGPEGQPLEDGNSLLQIAYTIENRGEGQTCSQRSEGGWRLTLPDGDGVNDLRVSERCVAAGDTVTGILTGFIIPTEEFAGDYELLHRRGSGATDPAGEVSITLVDGEGVRLSELD